MKLSLQCEARDDLEDAALWYQAASEGLGAAFLEEVEKCFARITEFPEAFPLPHRQVRRSVVGKFPFCVYYTINRDEISVIALLHGSRDPNDWKTRA